MCTEKAVVVVLVVEMMITPCVIQGGSEDVKRHKWFRGVDWIGLLDKTVRVIHFICGPTQNDFNY